MLAQLAERPEVAAIAVDRGGEHLRVRLRDGAPLAPLRDALAALGFASEPVAPGDAGRWYGPTEVGELSGLEAAVIAARVVAGLGLDADPAGAALRDALGAALQETFVAAFGQTAPGAALAAACAAAAERAARPIVGPRAGEVGAAVAADLAGDR